MGGGGGRYERRRTEQVWEGEEGGRYGRGRGGGGRGQIWEGEEGGRYGRGRKGAGIGGGGGRQVWEGEEGGRYGRGRRQVLEGEEEAGMGGVGR